MLLSRHHRCYFAVSQLCCNGAKLAQRLYNQRLYWPVQTDCGSGDRNLSRNRGVAGWNPCSVGKTLHPFGGGQRAR